MTKYKKSKRDEAGVKGGVENKNIIYSWEEDRGTAIMWLSYVYPEPLPLYTIVRGKLELNLPPYRLRVPPSAATGGTRRASCVGVKNC